MRFPPIDPGQISPTPLREILPGLRTGDASECWRIPKDAGEPASEMLRDAAVRFLQDTRIVLADAGCVLQGFGAGLVQLVAPSARPVVVMDGEAAALDFQFALEGAAGGSSPEAFTEGQLDLSDRVARLFAEACRLGAGLNTGAGVVLAETLIKHSAGFGKESLLLECRAHDCLCAVMHRTGAGFLQYHPAWEAAPAAAVSHLDLLSLAGVLSSSRAVAVLDLTSEGNLAGVMLHALAVARNLGATPFGWHWIRLGDPACDLAPRLGEGIEVLHVPGKTEILLPLLRAAVKEMDNA